MHLRGMSGRLSSTLSNDFLRAFFRTDDDAPAFSPCWNLAPGHDARVVRRRNPEDGIRGLATLRWGLLPHFTKNPATALRPSVAPAEILTSSPIFCDAYQRRRCLVPAELFYEWQVVQGGVQPHAVARLDGAPLALGGIWEGWLSPLGEPIRSFALVTTAANADMRPLSDRMPLVVQAEDWPTWLGETRADPGSLLQPAPDGMLMPWPVSNRVDILLNNDVTLSAPVQRPRSLNDGA